MIVPSQWTLGKFLEDSCGSVMESLMSLYPYPNTFTTNPDNLIWHEVETPAPSLLHPIQDIDEAPLPATSYGSFQFPLFPKAKKHATSTLHKVSPCQVWEIYGGNSGNSGRQVWTYEMSEGTSASAYVLHPFQTLVPRFQNEGGRVLEIGGSE